MNGCCGTHADLPAWPSLTASFTGKALHPINVLPRTWHIVPSFLADVQVVQCIEQLRFPFVTVEEVPTLLCVQLPDDTSPGELFLFFFLFLSPPPAKAPNSDKRQSCRRLGYGRQCGVAGRLQAQSCLSSAVPSAHVLQVAVTCCLEQLGTYVTVTCAAHMLAACR